MLLRDFESAAKAYAELVIKLSKVAGSLEFDLYVETKRTVESARQVLNRAHELLDLHTNAHHCTQMAPE
jgi:hypothetical protein